MTTVPVPREALEREAFEAKYGKRGDRGTCAMWDIRWSVWQAARSALAAPQSAVLTDEQIDVIQEQCDAHGCEGCSVRMHEFARTVEAAVLATQHPTAPAQVCGEVESAYRTFAEFIALEDAPDIADVESARQGWNACQFVRGPFAKYGDGYTSPAPVPAQAPERLAAPAEPNGWRAALQFYADGSHFITHDGGWDTVSGEPSNFFCHESECATIEDGSIAKAALAGEPLEDETEPSPPHPGSTEPQS